jgi:hypothetical protein
MALFQHLPVLAGCTCLCGFLLLLQRKKTSSSTISVTAAGIADSQHSSKTDICTRAARKWVRSLIHEICVFIIIIIIFERKAGALPCHLSRRSKLASTEL